MQHSNIPVIPSAVLQKRRFSKLLPRSGDIMRSNFIQLGQTKVAFPVLPGSAIEWVGIVRCSFNQYAKLG